MKIKLINEDVESDLEIVVLKSLKHLDKNEKKSLVEMNFSPQGEDLHLSMESKKIYVGIKSFDNEDIKIAMANVIRRINSTKISNVKISLIQDLKELKVSAIVEGLLLGIYSFDFYKSTKKKKKKLNLFINCKDSNKEFEDLQNELVKTQIICKSVNKTRDIVNTAPEDYYPKIMAKDAKKIAKDNNLECKIYKEDYLKESNMNAMLAVGRASRHESHLIHLTYKPKNPKGKIVIVGKGLTYDAGGLSLKIGDNMISMKCDKSGGSAVLGIMDCVNKLNLDYEIHGIIGAVENMIGGDAYKPDDILKVRNGKTVEVRNTDAEGRLVLADCLCYAQDEIKDIDYIFDIATLTGATIVALGEYTTSVTGHSEKMKNKMQIASKNSGEFVGFLPYNRYLAPTLKSKIADIVNSTGSRAGGAIVASLFLDHFITKENKKKWLHLDIAGAAYREKVWGYNPYGGSGAGVRLILKFIENLK